MFRKHNTFNIFYLGILILNVYALVSRNHLLRMVSMPMIGMSLILYLLIKTKIENNFHKLIFVGLVLSMAGDIQLLFTVDSEFYLLTALIATMVSYCLYSIAYFIDFKKDYTKTRRVGNLLFVVSVVSLLNFYWIANKNLGDFKYPGILYITILSIMVILAAYRHKRTNQSSFKLILTGSFAFLVSDLSIGFYYFIEPEGAMMVSYLVAYLLAQYLVIMGTIERKEIPKLSPSI